VGFKGGFTGHASTRRPTTKQPAIVTDLMSDVSSWRGGWRKSQFDYAWRRKAPMLRKAKLKGKTRKRRCLWENKIAGLVFFVSAASVQRIIAARFKVAKDRVNGNNDQQ